MKLFSGHLRGLLTFAGRENREPFWLWVLICYVGQMVLSAIASIPMFVAIFVQVQHAIATGDPVRLKDPALMMHDVRPLMQSLGVASVAIGLVFVAFVAAAVVRRLHDGDRSGWWATPVLLLNIASQVARLAQVMHGRIVAIPGKPLATAAAGFGPIQFVSLLAVIALVVVLALPGTEGDNRFGPDPLAS